jgi:replicative DNA helicase
VSEFPLPNSHDAEQALLECVMIEADSALPRIVAACKLEPADFSRPANRMIWMAISSLGKRGVGIDPYTVREELERSGAIDLVGGIGYVSSLSTGVPILSQVGEYARIIRQRRVERDAAVLLNDSLNKLNHKRFEDVKAELDSGLSSLQNQLPQGGEAPIPVTFADELVRTVKGQVEWQKDNQYFFTGIPTGYAILDGILQGWQRGVLHVLGAYTSHSKTASLLDFSMSAAFSDSDTRILYFALEMTEMMMGRRLLASQSGVPLLYVKTGDLMDDAYDRFLSGVKKVEGLGDRWAITDSMVSIEDIERVCRMTKASKGLDVVFVDYLQLIENENEKVREREVNKVGKKLLDIAKSLDIAVVASAQLNEGVVNRPGHRPLLSDLRESRAVNQHARTVILMSRPWLFERTETDPDEPTKHRPCTLMYYVDKNSEGELGEFALHYNVKNQQIREEPCGKTCIYSGSNQGGELEGEGGGIQVPVGGSQEEAKAGEDGQQSFY